MENSITPKLRFPEFDNIQPYIKFGKVVASNIYGPRFNAKDYDNEGNVKTIRGTDVSSDGEFLYEQIPIANLDQNLVDRHKLEDGDLVMITTADCGLTGVFRKQNIDYISSAYGVRIRLNDKGYPYYFKYFFQTRHAKKEVASFVRKATVANLPGSDILRIKLNLPSIEEQFKIATFLTAIDKRIKILEKKKTDLEQYKKGVMQKIFSQEIRFKKEDGTDFPDWEEKKLSEVFSSAKGQGLSKGKIEENGENECVLYGELYTTYAEVITTIISRTNSNEGVKSIAGDLLVPCSTTTTGIDLANVTALNKADVLLGGDITILRGKENVDNTFYAYYLSNYKKNELARFG
ncbi:MAG: restriction endonuclease subunit S, partial [Tetragenococcus halophilus]|nr:restriction endonuclease subunit S [Tetragenococcus halophilus]